MAVLTPERRRAEPPPEPPQYEPPRRPRRDVPWGLIALGLVVLSIVFGVNWVRGILPDFHNPFATQTVDRSGPAVLKSIKDIREYRAATGNFQQIVDLQKDTSLPDELLGTRTLFVAFGTVDATVDFSNVGDGAVAVSGDRRAATITLPAPTLSDARIDPARSYVYDRNEGALNKIGEFFAPNDNNEQELYVLAEEKIAESARQGSGLVARARENTRAMLTSLLRALGFTSVTVRFEEPV
ncbi:MAG: DUF4230 domain-containing protein [Gaiellaceae bacterium]